MAWYSLIALEFLWSFAYSALLQSSINWHWWRPWEARNQRCLTLNSQACPDTAFFDRELSMSLVFIPRNPIAAHFIADWVIVSSSSFYCSRLLNLNRTMKLKHPFLLSPLSRINHEADRHRRQIAICVVDGGWFQHNDVSQGTRISATEVHSRGYMRIMHNIARAKTRSMRYTISRLHDRQ